MFEFWIIRFFIVKCKIYVNGNVIRFNWSCAKKNSNLILCFTRERKKKNKIVKNQKSWNRICVLMLIAIIDFTEFHEQLNCFLYFLSFFLSIFRTLMSDQFAAYSETIQLMTTNEKITSIKPNDFWKIKNWAFGFHVELHIFRFYRTSCVEVFIILFEFQTYGKWLLMVDGSTRKVKKYYVPFQIEPSNTLCKFCCAHST